MQFSQNIHCCCPSGCFECITAERASDVAASVKIVIWRSCFCDRDQLLETRQVGGSHLTPLPCPSFCPPARRVTPPGTRRDRRPAPSVDPTAPRRCAGPSPSDTAAVVAPADGLAGLGLQALGLTLLQLELVEARLQHLGRFGAEVLAAAGPRRRCRLAGG